MYAVFKSDGRQYKVRKNEIISLKKINTLVDEKIEFNKVLMIVDGKNIILGNPTINNSTIEAKIINHFRGKKIKIIKFNRRKHYRKQQGYCQYFTNIKITNIYFKEKLKNGS